MFRSFAVVEVCGRWASDDGRCTSGSRPGHWRNLHYSWELKLRRWTWLLFLLSYDCSCYVIGKCQTLGTLFSNVQPTEAGGRSWKGTKDAVTGLLHRIETKQVVWCCSALTASWWELYQLASVSRLYCARSWGMCCWIGSDSGTYNARCKWTEYTVITLIAAS